MDRPAGRSIREGRPLTDFLRAPAPAVAAPGRCHLVCYPRTDRPAPLPTSAGESEGDDSPISELRSRPARPLLAGSGESTERRAPFSVDAALRGHAPAVPLELLRALGTGASARVRRRAPAGLSCLGRALHRPVAGGASPGPVPPAGRPLDGCGPGNRGAGAIHSFRTSSNAIGTGAAGPGSVWHCSFGCNAMALGQRLREEGRRCTGALVSRCSSRHRGKRGANPERGPIPGLGGDAAGERFSPPSP